MATKTRDLTPAKARKQTAAADQAVTTPPQPANGNVSPSHRDILRQLYSSMLKFRTAAKALQRLRRDPQLGAEQLAAGHEAVVAGASLDLGPEDSLAVSPRNFAAHIWC